MKGQLGYVILVKMIIGILLVVLAVSIGKSCAQAFIPSASESVTSFNNFVDVIENTRNWASGTRQNVGLIMDKNTAIFGFAKGASGIYKDGGPIYQIQRPESCGSPGTKACVCLCSRLVDNVNDVTIRYASFPSCASEFLRCRQLSEGIDFVLGVPIIKLVPTGTSIYETPGQSRNGFTIKGGFILDRPSHGSYLLFESARDIAAIPTDGLFPRRYSVSIEKTKDNTLAICARTPCIEKETGIA